MKMFYALYTLIIVYSFRFVQSESPIKENHFLKAARTNTDQGATSDKKEGEVFHLQLNAPFNGRILTLADDSSLPIQKRRKRNAKNATSPDSVVNKVVNENQTLHATEAESLPVPEAIKWRWNERPEDSRRRRKPDSISRAEIPFNQKRRNPSRVIDDEISYIMPQSFSEDNEYYRYEQSKPKTSRPRRRKVSNRQRLPPDEDVYSLYSAGRPYRRRSRTRPRVASYSPPRQKDDTIISTIINTGSDFLKIINPFNFFGSSETEEPPPPPKYYYREREVPRYHYSNHHGEKISEKEEYRDPDGFLTDRLRTYKDEADVNDNYENVRISSPKLRPRLRNEPSPDFTRDDSLTDFDYNYDDYEDDKRDYRTKSSSPRLQDKYVPKKSMNYGEDMYAFRRKYPSYDQNYDFNFGKEKRSDGVKYSNEIFQNIDDTHTLDYLKEYPLREDLYIAKDGNIYLKESKNNKKDLIGLDMYGMEYPEYTQESKQYSQLRAVGHRMSPIYAKLSRSSASKTGREMVVKDINIGIVEKELSKEKQDPDKNTDNPHSNFALKTLTPHLERL